MKYFGMMLVLVGCSFISGVCGFAAEEEVPQALAAAQAWLQTVDQGDYAASWTEAASYFKQAVSQEQWEQAVAAARRPLGAVVSRVERRHEYMRELPGAPDGEYIMIQYETVFTNKQQAVETVTPMKDTDGSWRVSGYYIK